MGERKVLNKYYPPDIDFWKPPKLELARDRQYVVRLMIPFTMRCVTCGNHIYKGKKFNARKETVLDEKYLGMPIFRFYVRCPDCLSEITFKTDPENTDYVAEHGAYRTFQAENIAVKAVEDKQKELEEEEANNPMLALENRTKESRREMDILDVLEEIRDVNAQHEGVTFEQLMDKHLEREQKEIDEEEQIDDALAKAAFSRVRQSLKRLKGSANETELKNDVEVKKLKVDDAELVSSSSSSSSNSSSGIGSSTRKKLDGLTGLVKRKEKKDDGSWMAIKPSQNTASPITDTLSCKLPSIMDNHSTGISVNPSSEISTIPSPKVSTNPSSSLGLLSVYSDDSD